ncbi:hypothetical protein GC170_11785 [bacterium]|nr:hypothetical protein [bacterium]
MNDPETVIAPQDMVTESAPMVSDTTPEWRRFWDQLPEPDAIRDWRTGLTPGLIAAALWLPWIDLPAQGSLPFGDLQTVLAGVWAGAWAALPLVLLAMSLVRRRNRPVRRILAEALGPKIGPAVVLATHGVVSLLVLTLSIELAAEWYFRTLQGFGVLETPVPDYVRYFTTSLWALWIIPIGYGMVRIMAALVDNVIVLIVGVLAAVLAYLLLGTENPRTLVLDPSVVDASYAFRNAFRATFGFSAVCGLYACEWGLGLKSRKDGIFGTVLGLGFGVPIVGTIGVVAISIGSETVNAASMFDLVAVLGRWPLLICGLLVGTWIAAPGVFASYHLLQDLRQVWPKVYHQRWMWVTIVAVQLLIATGVRYGLYAATGWLALGSLVVLAVLRCVRPGEVEIRSDRQDQQVNIDKSALSN